MVKNLLLFPVAMLLMIPFAVAQPDTLRLEECYTLARDLSPLKKQELLHADIYQLRRKNQGSNYLPDLSLNGKATYQSEVITIPGTGIFPDYPEIPKEQFQVSLDIHQNIYDGGLTKNAKKMEEYAWKLDQAELETELYAIQTTINDLYFSILQLQENAKVFHNTLENLMNQQKIISVKVREGVILENNLNQINKQILSIQQEIISVEADKNAMIEVLSIWTGQFIQQNTVLEIPVYKNNEIFNDISRPENDMFQANRLLLESQQSMINAENLPKFSAFVQGGIGQPNPVNFFEVDPATYYLLGLRLNWPVFDWGTASRKRQVYGLQQDIVNTRESEFNRNMEMALTRLYANAGKLEEVIRKDEEIIALQEKIAQTAFSEFQHGIINSTDYLTELNALTDAEIKRSMNKIKMAETYARIYTVAGQNAKSNDYE
jgi:outer membrane protein TolC